MRAPRVLAVDIGAGHVACGVFTVGATGRLVLQQVMPPRQPQTMVHNGAHRAVEPNQLRDLRHAVFEVCEGFHDSIVETIADRHHR